MTDFSYLAPKIERRWRLHRRLEDIGMVCYILISFAVIWIAASFLIAFI